MKLHMRAGALRAVFIHPGSGMLIRAVTSEQAKWAKPHGNTGEGWARRDT